MHDDRIAGVTFEENTSRNALIVNEEYAWVGNPFSAPKQQGEPQRFSLLLCVLRGGPVPRDLKASLPGAGGVGNNSREITRAAARVRVPFPVPKQQGAPSWRSPLLPVVCWLMGIRPLRPQGPSSGDCGTHGIVQSVRPCRLSGCPAVQIVRLSGCPALSRIVRRYGITAGRGVAPRFVRPRSF